MNSMPVHMNFNIWIWRDTNIQSITFVLWHWAKLCIANPGKNVGRSCHMLVTPNDHSWFIYNAASSASFLVRACDIFSLASSFKGKYLGILNIFALHDIYYSGTFPPGTHAQGTWPLSNNSKAFLYLNKPSIIRSYWDCICKNYSSVSRDGRHGWIPFHSSTENWASRNHQSGVPFLLATDWPRFMKMWEEGVVALLHKAMKRLYHLILDTAFEVTTIIPICLIKKRKLRDVKEIASSYSYQPKWDLKDWFSAFKWPCSYIEKTTNQFCGTQGWASVFECFYDAV